MASTLSPGPPIADDSDRRPPPASAHRQRLAFLDGMRGLTAFYVVAHHVYTHIMAHDPPQLYGVPAYLSRWLDDGQLAVAIFIVLSGYCLMLPATHNSSASLPIARFLQRRAARILPPYYAALALSLLLIAITPIMQAHTMSPWDNAVPAFTPGRLVSHLFLMHDATIDWLYAIDPPMWSIAIEWQIYFIFIFLLYPTWRRFGIIAAVALAFAIGLAPPALGGATFIIARFWYVGLFATGMLGAVVTGSHRTSPAKSTIRVPTVDECGLIWALLLVMVIVTPFGNDLLGGSVATDALLGILTTATIIAMAQETQRAAKTARSLLTRILESPPLVQLGAFSYSLYLVHFPIVAFFDRVLSPRVHSYRFPIAMFALSVPAALLISYAFHLAFERPFMRRA